MFKWLSPFIFVRPSYEVSYLGVCLMSYIICATLVSIKVENSRPNLEELLFIIKGPWKLTSRQVTVQSWLTVPKSDNGMGVSQMHVIPFNSTNCPFYVNTQFTFAIVLVSLTSFEENWPSLERQGGRFKLTLLHVNMPPILKPLSAIPLSLGSKRSKIPQHLVIYRKWIQCKAQIQN